MQMKRGVGGYLAVSTTFRGLGGESVFFPLRRVRHVASVSIVVQLHVPTRNCYRHLG